MFVPGGLIWEFAEGDLDTLEDACCSTPEVSEHLASEPAWDAT